MWVSGFAKKVLQLCIPLSSFLLKSSYLYTFFNFPYTLIMIGYQKY